MRIAKILATTGITRRTKMAGLLSMLGKTAGRAFQKHPIGAPVAAGAGLAALTGTLGNEESGLVGRNQGKVKDAFGFGTEQEDPYVDWFNSTIKKIKSRKNPDLSQASDSDLIDLAKYFKYPSERGKKAHEEQKYASSYIWNEINKRRESEGLAPMPT